MNIWLCSPTSETFQLAVADNNAPENAVMQLVAANILWTNVTNWVQDKLPAGIRIRKNANTSKTPFIKRLHRQEKKIKAQLKNKHATQRPLFLKQNSHVYILKDELTNELVKGEGNCIHPLFN